MTFDARTLLAESRLGVLATIKSNGLPQLSPVTPFYDRDTDVVYVSMTEGRAKTPTCAARPRAASRSPAPTGGRGGTAEGIGDTHRAGVESGRAKSRGARRLLPPRRR